MCPYHPDSTPSFHLRFDRRMGKCFGSGCGKYVDDIVSLFAHLRKRDYADTLVWLNTRLNLTDIVGDVAGDLSEYRQIQEMKKQAAVAFGKVVDEYLRDKSEHLDYLRPGLTYLETGRGIPSYMLSQLPVSVFPKPEHAKAYIDREYHSIYDDFFAKWNAPQYYGDIVFHYNDSPSSISVFKLRRKLDTSVASINQLLQNGTATPQSIRPLWSKEFLFTSDRHTTGIGVYGLHHYTRLLGMDIADAYVTEGEFDVLSVMAGQISTGRENMVMLAASGTGGITHISFLRKFGIRTVYIVQDSEAKNGDGVAFRVLNSAENFIKDSTYGQLSFRVFQWPGNGFLGGDLDEAVHANGFEIVDDVLYAQRNSSFISSLAWFRKGCDAALKRIKDEAENKLMKLDDSNPSSKAERDNILDARSEAISATIAQWMGYIHVQTDKLAFSETYAANENVDLTKIQEFRNQIYALNTGEGAKEIMKRSLQEYFEFAFYRKDSRESSTIFLWSKHKHELVALPTSEELLAGMLSQYIGKNMLSWAKSIFGDNRESIICSGVSSEMDPIKADRLKRQNCLYLIRQAMEDMISSCDNVSVMNLRGQGIHHFDLEQSLRMRGIVYVANGSKLFKGTYQNESGLPVEWQKIDNTVDEKTLFSLDHGREWSHISEVSDLYRASQVDIKKLYESVRTILRGWTFKGGDIIPEYLAAFAMSAPIQAVSVR